MSPQRVAQVMMLILLAPDIQEQVLGLESVDGVAPVSERVLRGLAEKASWTTQRAACARMRGLLAHARRKMQCAPGRARARREQHAKQPPRA